MTTTSHTQVPSLSPHISLDKQSDWLDRGAHAQLLPLLSQGCAQDPIRACCACGHPCHELPSVLQSEDYIHKHNQERARQVQTKGGLYLESYLIGKRQRSRQHYVSCATLLTRVQLTEEAKQRGMWSRKASVCGPASIYTYLYIYIYLYSYLSVYASVIFSRFVNLSHVQ